MNIWTWLRVAKLHRKVPEVSRTAHDVLLTLGMRLGENDNCWPTQAQLGKETGLPRSTLLRCLKELKDTGFIATAKVPGKNQSKYYPRPFSEQEGLNGRIVTHTSVVEIPQVGPIIVPAAGQCTVPNMGHTTVSEVRPGPTNRYPKDLILTPESLAPKLQSKSIKNSFKEKQQQQKENSELKWIEEKLLQYKVHPRRVEEELQQRSVETLKQAIKEFETKKELNKQESKQTGKRKHIVNPAGLLLTMILDIANAETR
ncbi:MAG: MarR family transcriptional regulator [Deltaproteobacteria bacterium]|nr:MarR family transcriptional regulator [Deltaproteobacteria bacterium]